MPIEFYNRNAKKLKSKYISRKFHVFFVLLRSTRLLCSIIDILFSHFPLISTSDPASFNCWYSATINLSPTQYRTHPANHSSLHGKSLQMLLGDLQTFLLLGPVSGHTLFCLLLFIYALVSLFCFFFSITDICY